MSTLAVGTGVKRLRARRSRRTLARFVTTAGMVALMGVVSWLIGVPAAATMAALSLGLSLADLFRHLAMRERLAPPYLNSLDEAAWFFLIGHALRVAGEV